MPRKTKKKPAKKTAATPPPAGQPNGVAATAVESSRDAIGEPRDPILRRTVRLLPCRLTDPELLAVSRKLGDALQDVTTETERQASQKKELSARIAGMNARVSELAAKLRRGEEDREITVEVRADFAAAVAREIRLDTEAVLLTRELTPAERQRPLPGLEPPSEPETAATNGTQTAELNEHVAANAEAAKSGPVNAPARCIECGEPIETSAAETCAGEGGLCDGGLLHPGCGEPHQAAHEPVGEDGPSE